MKMRRLLTWLLVVAMCFTLVACKNDTNNKSTSKTKKETTENIEATDEKEEKEQSTDKASSTATPILYRVIDEDGNVIWLFGSIHVGREDFYPLPDYVQEAFEGSDELAVECDIVAFEKDMKAQMNALTCMLYYDGTKISDHISEELYKKSVAILKEYKSYAKALDMYCPALWGSMIESLMMDELGGDVNLGIDRNLIDMAYEAEKDIFEIESAEFQYQILASFDEEIQILLLESAVQYYENKEEASDELIALMDLWASGDEKAFAEYLNTTDDTITEEEKQAYERYNQAMALDRNLNMADYAEEALASGKEIFICVGAAHVVGEGAMADLLAQRGYTVELVK